MYKVDPETLETKEKVWAGGIRGWACGTEEPDRKPNDQCSCKAWSEASLPCVLESLRNLPSSKAALTQSLPTAADQGRDRCRLISVWPFSTELAACLDLPVLVCA